MSRAVASALPVWLLALVGAVVIAVAVPADQHLDRIPVVFALCLLATFVIQLVIPVKQGLVGRMIVSVVGAVVVLALATGVLALVG